MQMMLYLILVKFYQGLIQIFGFHCVGKGYKGCDLGIRIE